MLKKHWAKTHLAVKIEFYNSLDSSDVQPVLLAVLLWWWGVLNVHCDDSYGDQVSWQWHLRKQPKMIKEGSEMLECGQATVGYCIAPNTCTHSVYLFKYFYVAHPHCPNAVYIRRVIGRVVGWRNWAIPRGNCPSATCPGRWWHRKVHKVHTVASQRQHQLCICNSKFKKRCFCLCESTQTCFRDGLEISLEDGSIPLSAEGEGDQHHIPRGRQLHDRRWAWNRQPTPPAAVACIVFRDISK